MVVMMEHSPPRSSLKKRVADSIVDAAKKAEDAASSQSRTVSRRRVKWTRIVATGSTSFAASAHTLEVDMTDAICDDVGETFDTGDSAPLSTAIEDEIEANRLEFDAKKSVCL